MLALRLRPPRACGRIASTVDALSPPAIRARPPGCPPRPVRPARESQPHPRRGAGGPAHRGAAAWSTCSAKPRAGPRPCRPDHLRGSQPGHRGAAQPRVSTGGLDRRQVGLRIVRQRPRERDARWPARVRRDARYRRLALNPTLLQVIARIGCARSHANCATWLCAGSSRTLARAPPALGLRASLGLCPRLAQALRDRGSWRLYGLWVDFELRGRIWAWDQRAGLVVFSTNISRPDQRE